MKNAIISILLLTFFSAHAQQVVSLDSSWVVNSGGIFFEHRLIEFLNGESTLTKKRLGDTLQVVNSYKDNFIQQSSSWATDIEWTSSFKGKVTELIRQDAALTTTLGKSPVKAILVSNKILADSSFRIKESGKPAKVINFTISAQQVLRYNIDTFAQRTAVCLGNTLRLNNYLNSGQPLDLYKFKDGRWRDGTKTVQVFLQSAGPQNAQNRDPGVFFVEAPVDLSIIYEGGIVLNKAEWVKYDSKKKKWVRGAAQKPIIPVKL